MKQNYNTECWQDKGNWHSYKEGENVNWYNFSGGQLGGTGSKALKLWVL